MLIQEIHSLRFDCCVFLFYSSSAVTFATQSARSDGSLRSTNSAAIGGIADMPGSSQAARYDATDPTRTLERLTHLITSSVRIKRHRHFDARYGAPSDVLVLSRTVFPMRARTAAISATA